MDNSCSARIRPVASPQEILLYEHYRTAGRLRFGGGASFPPMRPARVFSFQHGNPAP